MKVDVSFVATVNIGHYLPHSLKHNL